MSLLEEAFAARDQIDTLRPPEIPELEDWRERVRDSHRVHEILLTPAQAAAWAGMTIEEVTTRLPYVDIGGRTRRFWPKHVQQLVDGVFSLTRYRAERDFEKLNARVGNVYLVEAVGTDRVKIGFTEGPVQVRLRRLQTSSPFELRVLAALPGSLGIERHLHQKYASERVLPTAEWFHLRGPVARLVDFVVNEGRWP